MRKKRTLPSISEIYTEAKEYKASLNEFSTHYNNTIKRYEQSEEKFLQLLKSFAIKPRVA